MFDTECSQSTSHPSPEEDLQYLGSVPMADLITSPALRNLTGMVAGTGLSTAPDWLKFKKGSVERYIPRGPISYGMTWNEIHAAGVAYGKEVVINGLTYTCRLLKGAGQDPTSGNIGPDEGEFNELFYAVCTSRPADYTGPKLASMSYSDLRLTVTRGFAVFCQETRDTTSTSRLRRNTTQGNIRTASFASQTYRHEDSGWWPVLERQL